MSTKDKLDKLRELLNISNANNQPPNPLAGYRQGGVIGPSKQPTPAEMQAMMARQMGQSPSPEEMAARQKAETLQRMEKLTVEQRRAMQQIHSNMTEVLKGFSPTALAKVIARDAELHDLIAKALFLVPAFQPEKTDDRPTGS